MQTHPWWQGAIIYQIYPRSFFDSNNDGIGDLQGITEKLDYVADLGVDAIWVSPFFESPMKDFGYDISNFQKVDPIFGTLDDFDTLVSKAHALGLKVMIDQVLSHTSDQHEWFLESQKDALNPKADWYVWADGKHGGPPNNWLSVFGGSAWQWSDTRQQYYLHNFLTSQPDLNYHCPELRAAVLNEVRFWLDRGVNGFRFDAINYCYHDQALRDNPTKPKSERKARGFSEDNPYAAQYHYYDNNRPEMLPFLQELRSLLNEYPEVASIGEINTEDSLQSISEYTTEDKLHLGYSFELLSDEQSPQYIQQTFIDLQAKLDKRMACWAISNHDVKRVASRWAPNGKECAHHALMLSVMLACLRGSICVYQGEELGLGDAIIEQHQLQDPFGIRFWPEFKGRDGCRTPIPWQKDTLNAGFSNAEPWLPIWKHHIPLSITSQQNDSESCLRRYQEFLQWRKTALSLKNGDIEFFDINPDMLCFSRFGPNGTLLCLFNFSEHTANIEMSTLVSDNKKSAFNKQISQKHAELVKLTCVKSTLSNDIFRIGPSGICLAHIEFAP